MDHHDDSAGRHLLPPPAAPAPRAADGARAAPVPRWAWVLLTVSGGLNVGGAAGVLVHADGASIPSSILTGGAAFAGTVALLLALIGFAGAERRP